MNAADQIRFTKTRRSWNEPGHAHFLTYSCNQRWPLLKRHRAGQWVVDALERARRELEFAIWAYVIMPEHVHVLMCPNSAPYDMSRILVALKKPVATCANAYLRSTDNQAWLDRLTVRYPSRSVFRFWQAGGGYDRNIFRDASVPSIVDYIHANPIRRGLVDRATDWEWSSARFWDGWEDVPIRMDQPFV
jgi:putative transposase